ncbi:MAG: glucosaminidase domain-containing protein [Phaeodactylibacter sp.]|nr:glucosaminidase domain-containing protein [Phaeodactylibacter sp.]MCB9275670.1 glucosaminidase domain-containing protein [Lewinellaceae bacterium]
MGNSTDQIKAYLQRNWFKLGIAVILLFLVLKKDLSFRINLNTPQPVEQPPQPSVPAGQREESTSRERYTERQTSKQAVSETLPGTERFDLLSSKGSRREVTAIGQLELVNQETVQAYIQRFGKIAATERKKYGVPASIVLANALLHSQAGTRALAKNANNQFALPCTPDWQGATSTFESRCYRQYENAWTSFRDHSLYVTTGPFATLRQLGNDDYKAWADALEKGGFSEEKNLSLQLVQVIETYSLAQWDR